MDWRTRLTDRFLSGFPEAPRAWRRVGREAEHPVVRPDGTAGDVSVLWPRLEAAGSYTVLREGDLVVGLEGPEHTFSAEVGRGTMEVIVGPCEDLHGIRAAYEAAMTLLLDAAEAEGLVVLGYGIQPVTPASAALMTPKRRYGVLHEVLGDAWLWFAVTASDQTHVEVSRDEVIAAADLANLLSPLVVGLLGNSPVQGGLDEGVCSAREAMMGRIHADASRHGMPGSAAGSAEEWVGRTLDLDYLMDRRDGVLTAVGERFGDWLDTAGLDEDAGFTAWELHDHYIWNSARPRCRHGTLELRAPCQQPWDDHMCASALAVGLVSAHAELAEIVTAHLGDDAWDTMRAWHHAAIREGLAAPAPDGLAEALLAAVEAAVVARGRGEEVYLRPLRRRLEAGRNAAQEAADVWRSGGAEALVAHARVR